MMACCAASATDERRRPTCALRNRENDTGTDNASEEDVTEDADDGVAASGENDDSLGSGGEDVQTTPAGSRAPLLFGGVAFLALGGYAGLRLAQSR